MQFQKKFKEDPALNHNLKKSGSKSTLTFGQHAINNLFKSDVLLEMELCSPGVCDLLLQEFKYGVKSND